MTAEVEKRWCCTICGVIQDEKFGHRGVQSYEGTERTCKSCDSPNLVPEVVVVVSV